MATAAKRASTRTTLTIGQVQVEVGLFATADKPGKLAQFTTAGPNGGVLKAEWRARATPVADTVDEAPDVPVHSSDPFAELAQTAPTDEGYEEKILDAVAASAHDEGRAVAAGQTAADVAAEERGRADGATKAEAQAWKDVEQVDGEYGRVLVEDGTGDVVEHDQVRRGVRLDDGRFIDCTDQLADIEASTQLDRMSVVSFVDVTHVPRSRVTAAYYLGAGDEHAPKPLRLVYEALKATRRAAVVKVTKRSRQSLGVITATAGTLVFHELVWAEDFRPAPPRATALAKASVNEAEVAMAVELVRAMSGTVDTIDALRDDAIALRETLHAQALAGEIANVVVPRPQQEAQDVLAQLEASLAGVSA